MCACESVNVEEFFPHHLIFVGMELKKKTVKPISGVYGGVSEALPVRGRVYTFLGSIKQSQRRHFDTYSIIKCDFLFKIFFASFSVIQ